MLNLLTHLSDCEAGTRMIKKRATSDKNIKIING